MKKLSTSRQYAPLRVCADICFYFYVVSLFSLSIETTGSDANGIYRAVTNLIAPWSLQIAVLISACFVLGFVIVRLDNGALRFLLSLLPGLSFLMSPFQPILLIHGVAWAYYVVVMTIGAFEVYLDVYRRRARAMLMAALLLTLCLIIFHFGTDNLKNERLFGGEICGLLYFFLTVLSLRGMRLTLGTPDRMRALDSAYVVTLPGLLVASFFLLRSVVPVFTGLITIVSRGLIWLTRLVFPHEMPEMFQPVEEEMEEAVEEETLLLAEAGDQSPGMELASGANPRVRIPQQTILWLMIVFLVAILFLLAFSMIRSKRKGQRQPKPVRERIERMPFVDGLLHRRSGESITSVQARQIRRIYRSYLEHIRSLLRLRITPSDTSQDVLDASAPYLDLPEDEKLRRLYIAARYGDPKTVTAEQVGEARRCLTAIEAAKPSLKEEGAGIN